MPSVALLVLLLEVFPVTREVYLMGTRCGLTSYAATEQEGNDQLEKYVRILEDTERELSVWQPGTPLSRFNRTPSGQPFQATSRLFKLFENIVFWWKETGKAFDPAVGRLLESRGFYGRPPAAGGTQPLTGMQHVALDAGTLRITRVADVWIDSGAFGKGEALDRVRRQAEMDGADPWLIDLGGQVMVYGRPPGKSSWTVDIAHPQQRDNTAMTVELRSGSLSITGNSERPGHVLDSRTGLPVEFRGSVVVWHERGLVADILSTALFVMGPENGFQWAIARGIAASFLIPSRDGLDVLSTPAFAALRR